MSFDPDKVPDEVTDNEADEIDKLEEDLPDSSFDEGEADLGEESPDLLIVG